MSSDADNRSLPPSLGGDAEMELWAAVHAGDLEKVRRILVPLVSEPDTDVCQFRRITPLHVAARMGLEDVVDRLLAAGATVNQPSIGGMGDLVGETPLHDACAGGHGSICAKLIAAGAHVAAVQMVWRWGGLARDALSIAVEHGSLPIVELLLEARADPDGPWGRDEVPESTALARPLAVAVFSEHAQIARVLLGAGADPDLESSTLSRSRERVSARHLARKSTDAEIRALFAPRRSGHM